MLLALALGSTQAAALQLGQVQVKSALGQPLLAEIPLTPDSPAELRNLSAKLASPEDFARAGITGRPNIPLQFNIVNVGGQRMIRITSAVAVNDPYLDLLVEVDSASSSSVREFPILLDPPGTAPSTAATRAPARPASTPRPAPAASAAPASQSTAAGNGQYGPVQRGQTLSAIARQVAPAGVDPSQMLVALQQANPDAFNHHNINALKSGVVLRVPTGAQAQAMSVAAALAEVRRQNGEWRNEIAHTPATVGEAATGNETPAAPATHAADRLALVPPKQGGTSNGPQGGTGKGDAATRQDLLRSQEALTTLQQQSGELKSRLKDLQDINDKNSRLLALKDNEIAELQQKLAQAAKAKPAPAPAPAAVSSSGAGAPASAAVKPAGQSQPPAVTAPAGTAKVGTAAAAPAATTPAASGSAAKVVAPVAVAHKPVVTAKPVPRHVAKPAVLPADEQPWYMQTWAWAVAGAAVVLLILLALLGRRRKPVRSAASAPASSSLADRFGNLPAAPVSADPDQDELLDQLAEHPDDVGLHLELVSLYYSRRDVERFEAAAEAMHAHIADLNQAEWQDVVSMGQDLTPGHPLFAEPGSHAHAAAADEPAAAAPNAYDDEPLPPFDLDSYAAHTEAADVAEPPALPPMSARQPVSEYHFDFDLTPYARAPGAPGTPGAGQAEPAESASPAHDAEPEMASPHTDEPISTWHFDEVEPAAAPEHADHGAAEVYEPGQFSDDPIDTKLDLARAYLDMGDADGARAMLEEVVNEGSRPQQDAARRLLDSLH